MADRKPQHHVQLEDGQTRLTKVQNDAKELVRWAEKKPNGFTYVDADREFGWDRVYFYGVVREARLQLGQDDEFNMVCAPQGQGEPWLYQLVGSYADAHEWTENRHEDLVSRLQTVLAVATSVERTADKRSLEGRRAKKVAATVGYLLGELQDLEVDHR